MTTKKTRKRREGKRKNYILKEYNSVPLANRKLYVKKLVEEKAMRRGEYGA
jgi:hypothetical protein